MIGRDIPGRPNTVQFVYDTAVGYIAKVKAGDY
jgi:hypothetical protein